MEQQISKHLYMTSSPVIIDMTLACPPSQSKPIVAKPKGIRLAKGFQQP